MSVADRTAHPDYEPAWDSTIPPGGFVCNLCGTPVESEPCPDHGGSDD
nr:MAG TPA_asm: Rad50 zinc hook motif [Caudoviricetes sp.]